MNKNVLIVLGGGFVIAILVAIIVQASFGSKGPEMAEIAVAAHPIAAGADLKPGDVVWKAVPKETVFEGSIVNMGGEKPEDVAQGTIRRDMAANEPILQSSLIAGGNGNVLTANMKPGMRALAIKVSAESMVGGFINPGDKVDILLTQEIRFNGDNTEELENTVHNKATETILENIRVLAIDQTAQKEDDKAQVGRTVTLEVDQTGAEKLALASQMGELSLALLGAGEDKQAGLVPAEPRAKMTTDVEVSAVLQELNKVKRNSGGNANIVRIYNGGNVENVTVRSNFSPPSQE